ncbi:MAG: transglutaminase-like domain-containing protein, partial [Dokdonella sp.]
RLTQLTWQPSSASTASVTSHVGALERVDLPQGRRQLHRIQQTMNSADTVIESTLWVVQDYAVHKLLMPMLGMELTLLRCDRRCATAPNQSADIFSRTLMSAPRALTASELRDDLRYRLRSPQLHSATQIPDTGEQRVLADADGIVVDVHMHAQSSGQTPPSASDYAANDWLQSSAAEIIALAKRGSADGTDVRSRMRNLETFVRGFIVDKDLTTGYASALEVARDPRGDCTEHAVLLAALGRAQGIATRTVNGLAYSPRFAGQNNVFVPHAWVQAWTGERWESFDAALMGFDSGHIALSVGDGDPWRFYSGLELLGTLHLEGADKLPSNQIQ